MPHPVLPMACRKRTRRQLHQPLMLPHDCPGVHCPGVHCNMQLHGYSCMYVRSKARSSRTLEHARDLTPGYSWAHRSLGISLHRRNRFAQRLLLEYVVLFIGTSSPSAPASLCMCPWFSRKVMGVRYAVTTVGRPLQRPCQVEAWRCQAMPCMATRQRTRVFSCWTGRITAGQGAQESSGAALLMVCCSTTV